MAGQAPGSANSRTGESEHRSTQGRAGCGHATASPAFCLLFFIPLPRAPAQAWSSEALGAKGAPRLTWRNSSEGRDMPIVTHTQENATARKTPASCPAGPASMPDRPTAFPFLIPLQEPQGSLAWAQRPGFKFQAALDPGCTFSICFCLGQGLTSQEVTSVSPVPRAQCRPGSRPGWRPGWRERMEVASSSPFPLSWCHILGPEPQWLPGTSGHRDRRGEVWGEGDEAEKINQVDRGIHPPPWDHEHRACPGGNWLSQPRGEAQSRMVQEGAGSRSSTNTGIESQPPE